MVNFGRFIYLLAKGGGSISGCLHFWEVGCRFDRVFERDVWGRGGGGGVGGGEFLVGAGGGGGGAVGCEWVGVGVGWGGEGGGVGALTGSHGGWGLAAGECRRGAEAVRC